MIYFEQPVGWNLGSLVSLAEMFYISMSQCLSASIVVTSTLRVKLWTELAKVHNLTLNVLVTTIDALRHFQTG